MTRLGAGFVFHKVGGAFGMGNDFLGGGHMSAGGAVLKIHGLSTFLGGAAPVGDIQQTRINLLCSSAMRCVNSVVQFCEVDDFGAKEVSAVPLSKVKSLIFL
ncbi:hypothetical protein Cpin_5308 [Chitinophaga pinensis DSM 2588]|uniref:Uncharacterized protein n=1 Tax=Chitinophaga pinensis (strain ATCC 43595 / DSM 2588 / LMG 13176 / NBRC 15968 / NCIMB 11800 / UQM 2034) TaxID=485918 RepID=A0A979G862_CHIPD|nr:hypothetical protein Cpin_5308 [Chitinophaga pinensis DSM 2588]